MSGSGKGSCRSKASFSALGCHVYHDGKRVFWAFMHPEIQNNVRQMKKCQRVLRTHGAREASDRNCDRKDVEFISAPAFLTSET